MKRTILGAVIIVITILMAGCHSASSVTPQQKASVSQLASIPGADAKAALIKAGVPIGGTSAQQVTWAKSMETKANRHAFAQSLKIKNKSGFENDMWTSFKADKVVTIHGIDKTALGKFLDTDLPNAYASNQ